MDIYLLNDYNMTLWTS